MRYATLAAAVFGLDTALKSYIEKHYELNVRHRKLNGKIVIEKYYNSGAVLNLLAKRPGMMQAFHTAVMAAVGLAAAFLTRCRGKKLCKCGIALLLGGGASNLCDRYTKGHVVDYFHINAGPKWFRRIVFNVSDFFILLGVMLAAAGSAKE